MDQILRAIEMLKSANKVVALTGAGISAESNVPTFRGKDGFWKKFRAEDLATMEAFTRDPKLVWEWYGYRQQLVLKCEPNPAHFTLAKMEMFFPDFVLITQNVDGLHQRAGSKKMIEMHGNLFRARCMEEGNVFDFILGDDPLPKCPNCGKLIRPHIVWFGEALDHNVIRETLKHSSSCDVFLVIGTSAVVFPAASLPVIASDSGAKVIEINPEPTPLTDIVDISLRGKAGEILPKIWEGMETGE